jgi:GT2 family glycosyltransferase
MIKILIGIPVLDNIEMTRACLRSLYQYTESNRVGLEVSVLIVDNGSKENIAGLITNDFNKAKFFIHYERNQKNLGVSIAWNQILKFNPGQLEDSSFFYDYYVISNNDILFGPDWLQPLIETMEDDERIGWIAALENGSPVMTESPYLRQSRRLENVNRSKR